MAQPTEMTTTPNRIIVLLDENNGEWQGTKKLTTALHYSVKCWNHILNTLRQLEKEKQITIIPSHGGRGCKTIYKRNRNQAGVARKVTR